MSQSLAHESPQDTEMLSTGPSQRDLKAAHDHKIIRVGPAESAAADILVYLYQGMRVCQV